MSEVTEIAGAFFDRYSPTDPEEVEQKIKASISDILVHLNKFANGEETDFLRYFMLDMPTGEQDAIYQGLCQELGLNPNLAMPELRTIRPELNPHGLGLEKALLIEPHAYEDGKVFGVWFQGVNLDQPQG